MRTNKMLCEINTVPIFVIKYLYGKKQYLTPLIEGDSGFRFSDLSHYARMENDAMRDEELVKTFAIDKSTFEVKINDHVIDSESMTADPIFSFPARHCFCLCLSNRKDSEELYEKFMADVCIEVKVDLYIEFLNDLFKHRFKGMEIVAKDITYYGNSSLPKVSNPDELVFFKPDAFSHEDEFRIALFYPEDKQGFKTKEGDTIPFYNENESNHLTLSYPDREFQKQFIGEIYAPRA
ncbi:hypothetical protein SHLO109777_10560 [Shewanella loihica]|uniref:Uncharacterized protein n=1 Tax=Shewanella loihica (strain ATCC BAA-1088 / PV-4) TaxID=323850 RepID=A3QAI5_SHELP|nr:hypothetical protein [Shewanella loihica]ABO22483.1 hypothetical protein Shew_0611 [Shewanella loihica PV-4]